MGIMYRKIFHILHQSAVFRQQSTRGANPHDQEKGATKTLMLVLGIFIVCWFPYVVYVFYALVISDKKDIPAYLNPLVGMKFIYIFTLSAFLEKNPTNVIRRSQLLIG